MVGSGYPKGSLSSATGWREPGLEGSTLAAAVPPVKVSDMFGVTDVNHDLL